MDQRELINNLRKGYDLKSAAADEIERLQMALNGKKKEIARLKAQIRGAE